MMEWWAVLGVVFATLLLLLASGLPIFVCFILINVGCVLFIIGTNGLGLFVNSMTETTLTDSLVAIPLFVLLGELMFRTGGFTRLFRALDTFGEIIVLAVAAIGVTALLRRAPRRGEGEA